MPQASRHQLDDLWLYPSEAYCKLLTLAGDGGQASFTFHNEGEDRPDFLGIRLPTMLAPAGSNWSVAQRCVQLVQFHS